MPESGFYRDPLERHFARFYTGEGWAYRVRDADEKEWTYFDADLNDEFLKWLEAPSDSELIEAIAFEVPKPQGELEHLPNEGKAETLIAEFSSKADLPDLSNEGWIQGFNSRVRMRGDSIEIFVDVSQTRSSRWLSSGQDSLNQGLRTIPLRTVQAVHLTPAARGIMGALQFTVPGALTQQHRDSAGKALRVLSHFTETGSTGMTSQAHENSVSFEMAQQESFVAFHSIVVMKLEEISRGDSTTTSEPVDFVGQLRELKLLLDDGILTQEEFDSSKQAILKKL